MAKSKAEPKDDWEDVPVEKDDWEDIPVESKETPSWKKYAKMGTSSLPIAGGIGGGLIGMGAGALAIPGVGAIPGEVAGAGLGAAVGKSAETGINTLLGLDEEPMTREKLYKAPVMEGLVQATGQGLGMRAGEWIAAKQAEKEASRLMTPMAAKSVEGVPVASSAAEMELRPNAEQIMSSARNLGVRPTKGMMSGNKDIQAMEQVLSEQPTWAGRQVRSQYEPISQTLRSEAELAAPTTPFNAYESGQAAQGSLVAKTSEKLQPLQMSYNEIRESTRPAQIDPKSALRAANRLRRSDFAQGTEGQQITDKYASMLEQSKNADHLNQILSDAKAELRKTSGSAREAFKKIIPAAERLQRRGLIETATMGQETGTAAREGLEAAKGLIQQKRTTDKGYKELVTELRSALGDQGFAKDVGPGEIISKLDQKESIEMAERLFNVKKIDALKSLQKFDSNAFNILRQNRLNQVVEKSMTRGQVDPSKLVRQMKQLPIEAQEMLIGKDGVKKLRDVETIINSFPDIVNPSKTSKGIEWKSGPFTPEFYRREAGDLVRLMQIKSGNSSLLPMKTAKGLLEKTSPYSLPASGIIRSRTENQ